MCLFHKWKFFDSYYRVDLSFYTNRDIHGQSVWNYIRIFQCEKCKKLKRKRWLLDEPPTGIGFKCTSTFSKPYGSWNGDD